LFNQLRFSLIAGDALAFAFGYTSLLLPYAITFNNHVVAAGFITAALLLLVEAQEDSSGWRMAAAGGCASLAAVTDLPAGSAFLFAFGLWLTMDSRRFPVAFVLGALPLVLIHCVSQSMVTGTPLPAEFYPQSFLYPGSYWASAEGTFHETGPRWQFGLEMMFGPQGWLTMTPVLVFGIIGLGVSLFGPRGPLRFAALSVIAASVVTLVFYIWLTRRTDFAGQSFGTRHLLAISPVLYLFAAATISRCRGRAVIVVFLGLTLIGAVYAWHGIADPWRRIEERSDPALLALQRLTLYPTNGFRDSRGGN
jgi:hypothetical protein